MSMRDVEADRIRVNASLAPTLRHLRQSRLLVDVVTKHGAEAVHRLVGRLAPNDVAIIVAVLARRCSGMPEVEQVMAGRGRPRTDHTEFTPEEAKEAHAAYGRGERTEWSVLGDRAYKRLYRARRRLRKKQVAGLARAMFDRQAATYDADPALTELAWIDPEIRAFWEAEATAVLGYLEEVERG